MRKGLDYSSEARKDVSVSIEMKESIDTVSGIKPTLTEAQISARLSRNLTESPTNQRFLNQSPSEMILAAVLVPLISINHVWHVLYILRATNINDHHSGQVAFPGGRYEPSDFDMETTALREAREELGLMPKDVRVIGCLNEHFSTTNFRIRPVVGIIPWPYTLRIDEKEVSRWFTVPLDWLTNPANRETRHRIASPGEQFIPTIYFKDYKGELLWGASAKITVELTETLNES